MAFKIELNRDTYVKIMKLIKKYEPELWDDIKDTVFVESLLSEGNPAFDVIGRGRQLFCPCCKKYTHHKKVFTCIFYNNEIQCEICGMRIYYYGTTIH